MLVVPKKTQCLKNTTYDFLKTCALFKRAIKKIENS